MAVATVRADESRPAAEPDYRLTEAQFDKLNRYLASDYDFLGAHYRPRAYRDLPPEMIAA